MDVVIGILKVIVRQGPPSVLSALSLVRMVCLDHAFFF